MARDEEGGPESMLWQHRQRMEEVNRNRIRQAGRYLIVHKVVVDGIVGDLTRQTIVVDAAYGRLDPKDVEEAFRRHFQRRQPLGDDDQETEEAPPTN